MPNHINAINFLLVLSALLLVPLTAVLLYKLCRVSVVKNRVLFVFNVVGFVLFVYIVAFSNSMEWYFD